MAADITKSQEHILQQFVGLNSTTDDVPIKAFLKFTGAVSNPADITGVTNAANVVSSTIAATGVAVGDIVLGVGVVSGAAANQVPVCAYVSATDVVTVLWANTGSGSVTTTAATVNLIVADVT